MLWTVIAVLFAIWLVAVLTAATAKGLVHVLLLVALVMFVYNLIARRRSV